MKWTRRKRRRLIDGALLAGSQIVVVVYVYVLLVVVSLARHFYLKEWRQLYSPNFRAEVWFDDLSAGQVLFVSIAIAVVGSAVSLATRRHWGVIVAMEVLVPTIFCAWLVWRMMAYLEGGGFMYPMLFPGL